MTYNNSQREVYVIVSAGGVSKFSKNILRVLSGWRVRHACHCNEQRN